MAPHGRTIEISWYFRVPLIVIWKDGNHRNIRCTGLIYLATQVFGIRSVSNKAFSVQYHPEAAPGPHDSHYLFNEFAHLMSHNQFSDQTGSNSDSNEDLKKKEVNVV